MISFLPLTLIFISLYLLELLYFRIAIHFNIIDKPNSRSSHSSITLRGGGIIFTLSSILWFLFYGFHLPFFFMGLIAITLISFLDDILTLNNKIRLVVHLSTVLLLFTQWNLFSLDWYWLVLALVFVIGTINAYNFMDGINGLTGSYSLLTIITLYYINEEVISFTDPNFLVIVGLSLIVFNFFNFRNKSKCFAGDVGSVSIAFILIFLIGQLILATDNLGYVVLLLIYGLDATTTIFFRRIRKENIFEAHRSHFYQYLANQLKFNHLSISSLYFIMQLTCNLILIFFLKNNLFSVLIFVALAMIVFIKARFIIEGKEYLLKSHSS